jgi:hypothetical protein
MNYKVIILPPLLNLREKTLKLLKDFINSGGKVLVLKQREFQNISLDGAEYFEDFSSFEDYLEKFLPPKISVFDKNGKNIEKIYFQERKIRDKYFYFLCNTSLEETYSAELRIRKKGDVKLWNLFSGKIEKIPYRIENDCTILNLEFHPVSSYLISLDENIQPEEFKIKEFKLRRKIKLKKTWKIEKQDLNSLTLDFCQYKIENENWSEKVPVFEVQKSAEERGESKKVELKFEFWTGFIPEEIYLILENPEIYKIYLNKKEIPDKGKGYYLDIAFRKIDIKKYLKKGKNILVLSCKFFNPKKKGTLIFLENGVELESVYIVGNFSVEKKKKNYLLTPPKKNVKNGDLVFQGYPFFAGSINLFQEIKIKKEKNEKIFLNFEKISATTTKITINGKEAGIIFMKPYKLEISKFLKDGKNSLEIELTNSLRNLLGPHHHISGELTGVGPGSFQDKKNWTDEYNFVPFGIEKDVYIEIFSQQ